MLALLDLYVDSVGSAGVCGSVCFMSVPQRVHDEGGEPQKTAASAPANLLDLYSSVGPEVDARLKPESAPTSLFAESLAYELNRSLRGAAQLIGAEGRIAEQTEPQQASDFLGENAQMLGRAVGGLLPMVSIALGTRYGFGKILAGDALSAENALLKRTSMGLSAAESGTTGFFYGALLTPTDAADKDDFGSFALDRAKSGTSSALAFSLMSASSIGLSRLASTKVGAAIGAEKLMSIGAVNGIVSGIPGGLANVEADSLVRSGKFDFDRERLADRSMKCRCSAECSGLAPAYSLVLPPLTTTVAPEAAVFRYFTGAMLQGDLKLSHPKRQEGI